MVGCRKTQKSAKLHKRPFWVSACAVFSTLVSAPANTPEPTQTQPSMTGTTLRSAGSACVRPLVDLARPTNRSLFAKRTVHPTRRLHVLHCTSENNLQIPHPRAARFFNLFERVFNVPRVFYLT